MRVRGVKSRFENLAVPTELTATPLGRTVSETCWRPPHLSPSRSLIVRLGRRNTANTPEQV